MSYTSDQVKHKLRQLKKMEIAVRFQDQPAPPGIRLVWDVFFSTKAGNGGSVKYPMDQLLGMDRQQLKEVFEEYWCRIYLQTCQQYGFGTTAVYDARLLELIGLPPYAEAEEITQRYRDLAKKYHPDLGGDAEKFIALSGVYEQLVGKRRR